MPTDAEKEAEKRKEGYERGWKDAYKFDYKNPKARPPHPFDDLIKQKDEDERRRAEMALKINEANKYRPTPTPPTLAELREYQRKLYPENQKKHEILFDDINIGDTLRLLWFNNARMGGRLAPVMRQMIAIIKHAYQEQGVKMELLSNGKVRLSDPNGWAVTVEPEPWWEKEFPDVFAGARKVL